MKRIFILLKQAQNGWYHFDVPAEDVDYILRNMHNVISEFWVTADLSDTPQGSLPEGLQDAITNAL